MNDFYRGLFFRYETVTPYAITFQSCDHPPASWFQECVNTAQYISENTQDPLMIAYSGGIDSEIVCRYFLEINVPFKVFTLKYTDGSNDHDTVYADKFCKKYKIQQHIHYQDFDSIYKNFGYQMLDRGYHAVGIFRYLQLFLIHNIIKLNHSPILCSGELVFETQNNTTGVFFHYGQLLSVKYGKELGKTVWPYFFMTRPETVAAYINECRIEEGISELKNNDIEMSHELKRAVYERYFDLEYRPKFNGFEKNIEKVKLIEDELFRRVIPKPKILVPINIIKQSLYKNFNNDLKNI